MARIASTRLSRLLTGWASEGAGPLPRRLADALRELAARGDVPAGTVLPSQRELALVLAVSRSTVTSAYGLLEAEGWLESVRGSGSRLRASGALDRYVAEGRLVSFDARTGTGTAGIADLSSGALPGLGAVGEAVGALTSGDLGGLLVADGYHPYGIPALREGIAAYYRAAGVPTEAGQILVTAGSQQAVWLVAQALVEPGDTVVVEDPTCSWPTATTRTASRRCGRASPRTTGRPAFDARTGTGTAGIADLSSGALPGLGAVGEAVGALTSGDLGGLLVADGYHPYGIPALREGIAAYYRAAGVPTEAGQILVTAGSQQAVWLVAQALVEPGDTVVVEDPTYRGALEALRARGARLVPVGTDGGDGGDGSGAAAVRRLSAHGRPRLVYLQPTVHNPTGRTLDDAARREWRRVLGDLELFTVEDTACAELALGEGEKDGSGSGGQGDGGGAPEPLVAGLPMASTVTVGTLSKLFWGGLRVGWVRSSPQVVARLAKIKTSVDLSCSVMDQLVAVRLLDRLPEARARRRAELRTQRDTAEALLRSGAPHWEWTRPAGGAALWVRVPGADTETLAQLARRRGVSVVPGSAFSPVDGFRDRLRLPYAHGTAALEAALPTLLECAERAAAG
ncbi:PLP-dependent aminotransferase family protein [Streptomyces exfoliatus]|uniref:aminotransferase-like domain-containing protein n=1 Tax=Streptomyces exfoliatus TaxID=1905 RepID=UPI0018E31315|nr:PLP-dependent aminotransferase family protein [Streptomyces exfoliatus]